MVKSVTLWQALHHKCVTYVVPVQKKMNNLQLSQNMSQDITTYAFGLSTLNALIRFFKMYFVSYRIPIKEWQVQNPEEKNEKC